MVGFETAPFCSPAELLQGLTYSPENVKDHGLLVLRSSNIQNGQLVFDDTIYVDREVDSDHLIYKGDIIICVRNGSSALIGKCAIAKRDYYATWGAFMVCVRSDRNEFLYQVFQSNIIQKQIHGKSNATINQITTRDFRELTILLPHPPEQRAIARALSDVDGYIVALERLIAKKQNIKKGAMQELLTGKRRLPGFYGEWVNMNLAEKSTLKARIGWQGLTTAEYLDEGYSFLITGTDFDNGKIAWATCHFVDKYRYDQDVNIQVANNDVLITKDGTIGKVAIVQGLNRKATLNSGVFVLRPKAGAYNVQYVYYVLLSQIFTGFLDKLAAGSTINHLYQKDFVTFEFEVPPTTEEQAAISIILSEMDAEIDSLTTKLNKVRNIKQGMMQELLTGRIRLIQEDTDDAEN